MRAASHATARRTLLLLVLLGSLPARAQDSGNRGPRPLRGRGLENLIACARLLGYVRFFHPADQAIKVNWDRTAAAALWRVEDAESPDALAARLRELFAPMAPTVSIWVGGPKEAPPPPPPSDATEIRLWVHRGVGLSPESKGGALYTSRRTRFPLPL